MTRFGHTALTMVFALLLSCTPQGKGTAPVRPEKEYDYKRGEDSFEYNPGGLFADRPVTVYTYIPETGDVTKMPILITLHGAERSGRNGIICWSEFAERDGFIVVSPEFSKSMYSENDYQFGGVTDPETHLLRPKAEWTYSIIEPLFDYIREKTGNTSETYHLQGHSAGGQFVHRFLLAVPDARVGTAVACNPGSWTWVDPSGRIGETSDVFTWPYSVQGTPMADRNNLASFFARKFYVCLGSLDTDTTDSSLPKDKASMCQGKYRLERGRNFFAAAEKIAGSFGLPFSWELSIVDGIGHQGRGMVYGKKTGSSYSADNYSETAAYYLIFGKEK